MSFALLTNTGRSKEAAAIATGTSLTITEIAWGDGAAVPSGGETTLQNEQGRKAVNSSGVVPDALNTAYFEILLEVEEGPFVIREMGVFDADGDMIAIAHFDPAVNKPVNHVSALLRMNVLFNDLENLVLNISSAEVYAPQERSIGAGTGLTGGGDLSQDRTLAVAFATTAQAISGTSTDRAMSPARVQNKIDDYHANTVAPLINQAAPAGSALLWLGSTPPDGYLELSGTTHSRASYADLWAHAQSSGMYDASGAQATMFGPGNGSTTFTLPDLRGEMLRVWDHGRGVDPGRALGSFQQASGILKEVFRETNDAISLGLWNKLFAMTVDGTTALSADGHAHATFRDTGNQDLLWNGHPAADTVQRGILRMRPRNVALMFAVKY